MEARNERQKQPEHWQATAAGQRSADSCQSLSHDGPAWLAAAMSAGPRSGSMTSRLQGSFSIRHFFFHRRGGSALPLLLLLLGLLSLQLELGGVAVVLAAPLTAAPPIRLIGLTNARTYNFLERAGVLYSLLRDPTSDVAAEAREAPNSLSAVQSLLGGTSADYLILPVLPEGVKQLQYLTPDFLLFPMWAFAYAPVVNLPEVLGDQTFVLSQVAAARIFAGLVTRWNDPLITTTNPSSYIALTNKPIEVVLPAQDEEYILAFVQSMRIIDPANFTILEAQSPVWPTSKYAKFKFIEGVNSMASYVLANPYSIALSPTDVAKALGVRLASLQNGAGKSVLPSYVSMQSALWERGVTTSRSGDDGKLSREMALDLTGPPGPNSWPWMVITAMLVPREYSRTSCRARSELVKLSDINTTAHIRWMFHSPLITSTLSELHGAVMVSSTMISELAIETKLTSVLHCAGNSINAGDTDPITTGGGPVATIHAVYRKTLFAAYSAQEGRDYTFITADELVTLKGALNPASGLNIAWLFTSTFVHLYPSVLESSLASGALTMFHISLSGVIPIFNLPSVVAARIQPAKAPLVIDLETLALIFLGNISSWLDPRLATYSPTLTASAFSGVDPAITVVLCGVGDPSRSYLTAIGNHFVRTGLWATGAFKDSGIPPTLPVDWTPMIARMDHNGVRYILVKDEIELEVTTLRTPGAIGYMLNWGDEPHPVSEFQLAMPVSRDATDPRGAGVDMVPVSGDPDSFIACAAAQTATSSGHFQLRVDAGSEPAFRKCWPLVMLLSLGIATDVHTAQVDSFGNAHTSQDITSLCDRHRVLARFVRWFGTEDVVVAPMRLAGRAVLAELADWKQVNVDALNDLYCDGQPLLWVQPVVWLLSSSVYSFGVGIGIAGMVATVLVLTFVLKYRRRTMIASGSLVRQVVGLGGLLMLFQTPILFAMAPSSDTCATLPWLLFIGATATLAPMCMRIRKVYRAYQRRGSSVKRLRQSELLHVWAPFGALLVLDLVILSYGQSQGSGLMEPLTVILQQDAKEHLYTHCSVPSSMLVPAALLAGTHLAMLLFAALWAFQIRGVTTAFNESANLSWAIWNATLLTVIVVPLIVLTGGMQGDTGVFLLLFLVSWMSICTLGFDYGYKIYVLLGEEIALAKQRMSQSGVSRLSRATSGLASNRSQLTSGGGSGTGGGSVLGSSQAGSVVGDSYVFEFAGVADVGSVSLIEKYIGALETQIRLARDRRQKEFGAPAPPPKPEGQPKQRGGGGGGHKRGANSVGSEVELLGVAHAPQTGQRQLKDSAAAAAAVAVAAADSHSPRSVSTSASPHDPSVGSGSGLTIVSPSPSPSPPSMHAPPRAPSRSTVRDRHGALTAAATVTATAAAAASSSAARGSFSIAAAQRPPPVRIMTHGKVTPTRTTTASGVLRP